MRAIGSSFTNGGTDKKKGLLKFRSFYNWQKIYTNFMEIDTPERGAAPFVYDLKSSITLKDPHAPTYSKHVLSCVTHLFTSVPEVMCWSSV